MMATKPSRFQGLPVIVVMPLDAAPACSVLVFALTTDDVPCLDVVLQPPPRLMAIGMPLPIPDLVLIIAPEAPAALPVGVVFWKCPATWAEPRPLQFLDVPPADAAQFAALASNRNDRAWHSR